MNKYRIAVAALLFVMVPNLQAGELLAEPVPAAYVSIPFGGSAKTTPNYGLQLVKLDRDGQQGAALFDAKRTAYLDVKFSDGDLSGLSLNGTDFVALAKLHGYNANGDNAAQQWWGGLSDNEKVFFVVLGIGAVGCVVEWCDGGRGSSDRRKR